MDRSKLKELVQLAGSVASITGVTLLWLTTVAPTAKLGVAIPVYTVASLLGIGVIALAWLLFVFGYKFFVVGFAIPRIDPSAAAKIAYTGIIGGIMIVVTCIALFWIFYIGWDFVQEAPGIFHSVSSH